MAGATQPPGHGQPSTELEEIRGIIRVNRADIDELQAQVSAAEERATEEEERAAVQARRLAHLEARLDVDGALIAELQTDGLLAREQVDQLEQALRTSRTIGAALGIIMADRQVGEREAFELLSKRSQDTNCKLRVLADEVVRRGDSSVVLRG
jgi:hypothetical protein